MRFLFRAILSLVITPHCTLPRHHSQLRAVSSAHPRDQATFTATCARLLAASGSPIPTTRPKSRLPRPASRHREPWWQALLDGTTTRSRRRGDGFGASPCLSAMFHASPPSEAFWSMMGLDIASVGNHSSTRRRTAAHAEWRVPSGRQSGAAPFHGAKFHYLARQHGREGTGKTCFPPIRSRRTFEGIPSPSSGSP